MHTSSSTSLLLLIRIDSAYYICTHTLTFPKPTSCRWLPNGSRSSQANCISLWMQTHTHVLTLHLFFSSLMELDPLRMTTRLLRISGHYPQALRPAARLLSAFHPTSVKNQVRSAPCASAPVLFISFLLFYVFVFFLCLIFYVQRKTRQERFTS